MGESNTPKKPRTLAVIGSRDFPQAEATVRYAMSEYVAGVMAVVSGGARGPDLIGETVGRECGLDVISYRPAKYDSVWGVRRYVNGEWGWVRDDDGAVLTYPVFANAAKARNWWIVRDADRVLAFWDGTSSGTSHGIAAAARYGRDLRIWMEGDS